MRVLLIDAGASMTEEDVSAVNSLLTRLTGRATDVALDDVLETAAHNSFFVVRDEEQRLRGMATLALYRKLQRLEGRVEDVAVDEACQRRGAGRMLMNALINRAKELGLQALHLTCRPHRTAANALYASLGFALQETNVYRLSL